MEIGELALEIWRTGMIAPLGPRLVRLLLEAIDLDRSQGTSNIAIDAIKGTILSFVEVSALLFHFLRLVPFTVESPQVQGYKKKGVLRLYQELFEQPFLDATGEHLKRDAARLLEERNVSLYMDKVIGKIDEEVVRARRFLHFSSLPKVTNHVTTSLDFSKNEPVSVYIL